MPRSTPQSSSQSPKLPLALHTSSVDSAHCEVPPRFGTHPPLSDRARFPQLRGRGDGVIGSSPNTPLPRPVGVDCWIAGAFRLPHRRVRVAVLFTRCVLVCSRYIFSSMRIFPRFLSLPFSSLCSFSNTPTLSSRRAHAPSRRAPPPPRCCCLLVATLLDLCHFD